MTTDFDLVRKLLTLAGTIMEDASAVAIINGEPVTLDARIATVHAAAEQALALATAARVALCTTN